MIAFLAIAYIGLLALLIKIGIIKLNTFWKISPLIWVVLLFVVLFIPMQWGAPSGRVLNYQAVIEIIPNVSGEVIDVPAAPLVPMKKGDVIFRIDPRPFEYTINNVNAQLALARVNLDRAQQLVKQDFAAKYQLDRYDAEVKKLEAQLEKAEFDLEQTVVRAPADGFIQGLTLRPGQRVANLPLRSWVAYVMQDETGLLAGIQQNMLRHVKPGQKAEIALKLFPGRIIHAEVESILDTTSQAQLSPNGLLPQAPAPNLMPEVRGVRLVIRDDLSDLPTDMNGGAVGTAVIYTEAATATHIIRKVMIRMENLLNYINPY